MVRPSADERALWTASVLGDAALSATRSRIHVAHGLRERWHCDDPATARDAFAALLDVWRTREAVDGAPHLYGWLGYDALRTDEPGAHADTRPRGDGAPLAFVARYGCVLTVDRSSGRVLNAVGDRVALGEVRRAWRCSADTQLEPRAAIAWHSRTDEARHRAMVETVREAIRDGAVYLVNVARVSHADEVLATGALASRLAAARADRMMLLDAGDVRVAGASMELALAWDRTTDVLRSGPIKGTRPRGATPAEDDALARELAGDPKELAENAMATDVHRNDFGRVARTGSVRVPVFRAVRRHAFVHHLESEVEAVARDDLTLAELLAAMLPVGSVTGAPKRAAMSLVAKLEAERRGLYTGVYGTCDGGGNIDLAVAIRTFVSDAIGTHYAAGGGIVIDSDPSREWHELSWKEAAAGRGDEP